MQHLQQIPYHLDGMIIFIVVLLIAGHKWMYFNKKADFG